MGEAALSGLVDGGRARLNFRLDRDGYFSGEGDTLLRFTTAPALPYTRNSVRGAYAIPPTLAGSATSVWASVGSP